MIMHLIRTVLTIIMLNLKGISIVNIITIFYMQLLLDGF